MCLATALRISIICGGWFVSQDTQHFASCRCFTIWAWRTLSSQCSTTPPTGSYAQLGAMSLSASGRHRSPPISTGTRGASCSTPPILHTRCLLTGHRSSTSRFTPQGCSSSGELQQWKHAHLHDVLISTCAPGPKPASNLRGHLGALPQPFQTGAETIWQP